MNPITRIPLRSTPENRNRSRPAHRVEPSHNMLVTVRILTTMNIRTPNRTDGVTTSPQSALRHRAKRPQVGAGDGSRLCGKKKGPHSFARLLLVTAVGLGDVMLVHSKGAVTFHSRTFERVQPARVHKRIRTKIKCLEYLLPYCGQNPRSCLVDHRVSTRITYLWCITKHNGDHSKQTRHQPGVVELRPMIMISSTLSTLSCAHAHSI